MFEITLPILFLTSEQMQARDTGMPYSMCDCDTKRITFYDITAISEQRCDKKIFTTIYTPAGDFTCALPPDTVQKQIREKKKEFLFN